jgi:hypothetical protein
LDLEIQEELPEVHLIIHQAEAEAQEEQDLMEQLLLEVLEEQENLQVFQVHQLQELEEAVLEDIQIHLYEVQRLEEEE